MIVIPSSLPFQLSFRAKFRRPLAEGGTQPRNLLFLASAQDFPAAWLVLWAAQRLLRFLCAFVVGKWPPQMPLVTGRDYLCRKSLAQSLPFPAGTSDNQIPRLCFQESCHHFMTERRREVRIPADLPVSIWGLDAEGIRFTQAAMARNISGNGALLSGLESPMRPGDLIGLQYGSQRARFRVVWARDSGGEEKIRVAVQKLAGEACPWAEELRIAGRPTLA